MRIILILMTIGFFSSGQNIANKQEKYQTKNIIGEKILGDFDGDGKINYASVVKIKEGNGNPIEDGTSDEFEIRFSGKKLKPIIAGCCEIILINEGDLDNDGTDEITLFQAPSNGCIYSMRTFSFIKGNWKQIVDPFLISTECQSIGDEDLQKRIFRENGDINFYETDFNSKNHKLIKKKVKFKK